MLTEVELAGWIESEHCVKIKQQVVDFRLNILASSSIKQRGIEFNPLEDQLDTFYNEFLGSSKNSSELWSMVRKLITLSHGQATIERGFSENKKLTCVNLREKTLIAKRAIVYHVNKV